jgi:alanine-synthesizing transaminase
MEMRFGELAEQLPGEKNRLYLLLEQLRAESRPIVDLMRGSVNDHGIVYPPDVLSEILAQAAESARIYCPDSLGQPVARRAVAEYYAGLRVTPEQVVVTPGTSVSYWYCFKLLAENGDEILCPQPSYPLFDYIARLCGVHLKSYRLLESKNWAIDLDYLEHQVSPRTRAIVLISPHNPTGMVADETELAEVADIASRHALPIIADEVFSEFLFGLEKLPRPAATAAPLVFTLNGFSKMFALAGMKIGWMAVTGQEMLVKKVMSALEIISDTFLPVNEIAQFAVADIFHRGQPFLHSYTKWVSKCFDIATGELAAIPFVRPRGGFYVTLPIRSGEEETALALLANRGILLHPGYYYDIEPNHLVMTFIHDPKSLGEYFSNIAQLAQK